MRKLPSGTTILWGTLHIQSTGQDVNSGFPVAMIYAHLCLHCPSPLGSRETRATASKVLMTEVGGTAVPCWSKVRNVMVFALNFQSVRRELSLLVEITSEKEKQMVHPDVQKNVGFVTIQNTSQYGGQHHDFP